MKEYETVQLNTYYEQASQHEIKMKVASLDDRRTLRIFEKHMFEGKLTGEAILEYREHPSYIVGRDHPRT